MEDACRTDATLLRESYFGTNFFFGGGGQNLPTFHIEVSHGGLIRPKQRNVSKV